MGYPQSPSELRQELIAEQFVRGQSDPELRKYLWVVIRTQKTLIEVCTDFSSLSTPAHLHRPAEQTFAVHQQMETRYIEDDCESEAVFAVGDRPPWTNRRPPEASGVPTLQQMFVLARQMGVTRCDLSADRQMPRDNSLEANHLSTRIGGFVPSHGLDAIILNLSVSVVDNLDTCNHVAQTHPYHLHQLAGSFSLRETNGETEEIRRETPLRPGPHPHRSTRGDTLYRRRL